MKLSFRNVYCAVLLVMASYSSAIAAVEADEFKMRDSVITVVQPEALSRRLVVSNKQQVEVSVPVASNSESAEEQPVASSQSSTSAQRIAGFRVQVFSDNNSRTAKSEARAKSKAINEAIPHYRTYVTYDAPYWRLKVGDFRSRVDAESAADEIKRMFPAYSREVRVVRDRINVKI